jgi:hypothetical protein
MQNNSFLKYMLFVMFVAVFSSCDKDFNEIGSSIIGDDHYGLIKDDTNSLVAYNQNLGSVQSNNLPINSLGYYNNPFFGKTKASVVTQIELIGANPTFGTNPTVTKVELSLPYYSTLTNTDATTGDHTYELDSIYGSSKIKLSVYESKYYLRDLDAATGFEDVQKYYSGDGPNFDANKNPDRLNDDADSPSQNDAFFFSNEELKTYKTVDGTQTVDTRTAPGMRLNLRKSFFQDKIFNGSTAGKLINNNVFKEYFRGLYFKTEANSDSPDQGSLAMLDFKKGKITITYNVSVTATDGTITTEEKTLILNLAGNTVNVFENDYSNEYVTNITSGINTAQGDSKLFLKGGAGSMAVISLFGETDIRGFDTDGNPTSGPNGVSDELDDLRNPSNGQKLLVNEANLIFSIDSSAISGASEPNRIYLYDLNNKRPIIDYYTDISLNSIPKFNKAIHGGIIEKATTGNKRGYQYKIRLTNHIRNLINKDSTNIRLGLVVTEAIATVTSAKLKTPTLTGIPVDRTPLSNVINPLGTVLFGNNIPVGDPNYAKRLKLEIYYTKPN